MKVLITGCGRSCTNWTAEIVKATNAFQWFYYPEDRELFTRTKLIPNYTTKLTTEHKDFNLKNLREIMRWNEDLYILWCFRHPVANVMAKIVRGQPASFGGDKSGEVLSDDATLESAINAVKTSHYLYSKVMDSEKVQLIRLETLIVLPEDARFMLYKFLNVPLIDIHLDAFKDTPNEYQKKRYGDKVDMSQAYVYENWQEAYDGYFKDKEADIDIMREKLKDVCDDLGYEL